MSLNKIVRIISESRLSIHDISRVGHSSNWRSTPASELLPRFNMPFECGLALGAIRFGQRKQQRDFLLLVGEAYQDKKTLSDLAGQDSKAHQNSPQEAVKAVRAFLSAKQKPGERTRGALSIWNRYQTLLADMPKLAEKLQCTVAEMQSFDYLPDWIRCMTQRLPGLSCRARLNHSVRI